MNEGKGGQHQAEFPNQKYRHKKCPYLLLFLLSFSRFKFLLHFFDEAKCVVEVCSRGDCLTRISLHRATIRAEIEKNIRNLIVLMPKASHLWKIPEIFITTYTSLRKVASGSANVLTSGRAKALGTNKTELVKTGHHTNFKLMRPGKK